MIIKFGITSFSMEEEQGAEDPDPAYFEFQIEAPEGSEEDFRKLNRALEDFDNFQVVVQE